VIGFLVIAVIVFLVARRHRAKRRAEILALVDRRILDVLGHILGHERLPPL
jgi:hypothetical protein